MEMAAEDSGLVHQEVDISFTLRATSRLEGPDLDAIERHFSSVVLQEVDSLSRLLQTKERLLPSKHFLWYSGGLA